eukprot:15337534-Alexandrium_andersonii.AAC.1
MLYAVSRLVLFVALPEVRQFKDTARADSWAIRQLGACLRASNAVLRAGLSCSVAPTGSATM